jgi:hypothetical protein
VNGFGNGPQIAEYAIPIDMPGPFGKTAYECPARKTEFLKIP